MKSLFKILGIIFGSLIGIACIFVNVWWFSVLSFGKDKVASNTFEVGLQKLENSDETKYFMEINYMANEKEDGLSLFEIKFNYMLDENQEDFYSQGLQFVGKNEKQNVSFGFYELNGQGSGVYLKETSAWPNYYYHYGFWGSYASGIGTQTYNYASFDDYDHTTLSTNPIGENSSFKIQLGDDLFLMEFKNKEVGMVDGNEMYNRERHEFGIVLYEKFKVDHYFSIFDIGYMANLLLNAVRILPAGTNSAMVFEFGDLFKYSKYDAEEGIYKEVGLKENEKIASDIKSYYAIKVTTSADGAKTASDSLFKAINGVSGYNSTDDFLSDDYFIGRSKLEVTENDFELIKSDEGNFLKLKEDFINYYLPYKDTIMLNVRINLDNFLGLEVAGFTTDNGLDKFEVYSCKFVETVNGNVVETEVAYA